MRNRKKRELRAAGVKLPNTHFVHTQDTTLSYMSSKSTQTTNADVDSCSSALANNMKSIVDAPNTSTVASRTQTDSVQSKFDHPKKSTVASCTQTDNVQSNSFLATNSKLQSTPKTPQLYRRRSLSVGSSPVSTITSPIMASKNLFAQSDADCGPSPASKKKKQGNAIEP